MQTVCIRCLKLGRAWSRKFKSKRFEGQKQESSRRVPHFRKFTCSTKHQSNVNEMFKLIHVLDIPNSIAKLQVWPGMVVQRPSQKSLRLTAIDSAGQIKVFLAMVSVLIRLYVLLFILFLLFRHVQRILQNFTFN